MDEGDNLGVGVSLQRRLDLVGIDGAAPLHVDHGHGQTVGFGDLRPTLAELSGVDDHHTIAT